MEELLIELGDQEVPFGKYKGDTLNSVYVTDPAYVRFIAEKEGLNSIIFAIFLCSKGE